MEISVANARVDVAEATVAVAELKISNAGLKVDIAELNVSVAGMKVDFAVGKILASGSIVGSRLLKSDRTNRKPDLGLLYPFLHA
jgi:hypothetical protein